MSVKHPNNFLQTKLNHNQGGSTLFICLVMLLAISIISLAGMRTSLLELVIANNKQQFSNTFQAAEEVIDTRLNELSLSIDGSEVADNIISSYTENNTEIKNSAGQVTAYVDSTIAYRTEGPSLGWDIDKGVAHHFNMDVSAMAPAKNATSNYRVGFYIIAPSTK